MNTITIFTDGSSRGNPGPGGWGSVVIMSNDDGIQNKAQVTELGGGEQHTTNNRMELMAAIRGLEKATSQKSIVDGESQIKIYSDSSYVINGITKWVHGWKTNGWKTKTKNDVVNVDLWMMLDAVVAQIGARNISWEYVGGHIGVAGNERCDVIATEHADGDHVQLYEGELSGYQIPNILNVSHDTLKLKAKKAGSKKASSKIKAHSYVSAVGGKIEIHHTWAECEKRVKGTRGARFKKSLDSQNEQQIIEEFGGKHTS